MKPCIAVFGPTASGKSSLGMRLAKKLNGVIISADSMQIYKNMDIGTAKPTLSDQIEVPHRMIDFCDPKAPFSVYDYKTKAESEIHSVLDHGQQPIIVGGTGLYLDALFFNTNFGDFEVDPSVREELKKRSESEGNTKLLSELTMIDPLAAAPLHEKDTKRILRALEVYYSTGKTLSEFKAESHREASEFSFLKFNLVYQNRQSLYNRINKRVDEMLEQGLLSETEYLLKQGLLSNTTAAQAIGYKELIPYFTEQASLQDCVDLLKQKTRNYAKRQMTWFRRYEDAHPIVMDDGSDPFESIMLIIERNNA